MEIIKETVADKYDDGPQAVRKPAKQNVKEPEQKIAGGAAIRKMQEIAQGIYDSTPGMTEEIPRQTSKILQNVKPDKKFGMPISTELTMDMKYEDWQGKYKEILDQYKKASAETSKLKQDLNEKQHRYIQREQEYKDVIKELQDTIRDESTRPLDIIEEKTDEQYLREGTDVNDEQQRQQIEKEKKLKQKNQELMDNAHSKHIKLLHQSHGEMIERIDHVQAKVIQFLKFKRWEILETFDEEIGKVKEQLRKQEEKNQDKQYDYKQKEKELNEHLETMTQVAQKIDDDNRVLMKKNQELKIQYLSQENDRDLLIRQLIFHKKENQRIRETHAKMKKQVEQIREAEKAEEAARKLEEPLRKRGIGKSSSTKIRNLASKPGTAASKPGGVRMNLAGKAGMNSYGPADMQAGLKRPNTTAMSMKPGGYRPGAPVPRPFTGLNPMGGAMSMNFMGGRAISANYANQNPKLRRFENLIYRLKKILESDKKSLRQIKTLCAKEIDQKNQLEKILRQCVDDVKTEIQKKKTESKVQYYQKAGGPRVKSDDDRNLTQEEREKILEVLLSQERVLTLLYDKTFPPRPQSQTVVGGARGLLGTQQQKSMHSKSAKRFSAKNDNESMRNFNYYGQTRLENLDEHDVVGLEREIEFIIRNSAIGNSPTRGMTATTGGRIGEQIVDINGEQVGQTDYQLPPKRNKTAGHGARKSKKRDLMNKKSAKYAAGNQPEQNQQFMYSKSQPNMQNQQQVPGLGYDAIGVQSHGFQQNVFGAQPQQIFNEQQ